MATPTRTPITNEDIRRCGDEIKQLRNQQFVLCTTSLGLLAAYAALLPRLSQFNPEDSAALYILFSIAILLVFFLLFIWSRQLRQMIAVISIWLEEVGHSTYEHDIRRYERAHAPVAQTRLTSASFLFIGLALPGLLLVVSPPHLLVVEVWLWSVFGLIDLAYMWVVLTRGMLKWGIDEDRIRANWQAILTEAGEPEEGTGFRPRR